MPCFCSFFFPFYTLSATFCTQPVSIVCLVWPFDPDIILLSTNQSKFMCFTTDCLLVHTVRN